MNWWKAWDSLQDWVERRAQRSALSEFSCAHCERYDSCGRPPSDDCIEKLEQIERGDDWRYRPVALAGNPRQVLY